MTGGPMLARRGDPHPAWLAERNAIHRHLNADGNLSEEESDAGIGRLNRLDGLLLDTPPSTPEGAIAQLLLMAHLAAEGHDPAEENAAKVLRWGTALLASAVDEAGGARGVTLLRGHRAIGRWLGISSRQVQHLDRQRRLPTFRAAGTLYGTKRALDEWRAVRRAGLLPIN